MGGTYIDDDCVCVVSGIVALVAEHVAGVSVFGGQCSVGGKVVLTAYSRRKGMQGVEEVLEALADMAKSVKKEGYK